MFNNDELWLYPNEAGATKFETYFDSIEGEGALFKVEVSPSEQVPAMICRYKNSDLILHCLRGRGRITTEDGTRLTVGANSKVRIARDVRFEWVNELREQWELLCFLPNGGAEAFLDALAFTREDLELASQAESVGCELYLPPHAAALPAPIKALENRIAYPMGLSFSL